MINPSCNNVVGNRLPVLGDPPFPVDLAQQAEKELLAVLPEAVFNNKKCTRTVFKKGSEGDRLGKCGIYFPYEGMENDTEVIDLFHIEASALGWTFFRAWYYWVVKTETNPLPIVEAKALNEKWGEQVRFDGFAGGIDVSGPGTIYHVDTIDGLEALISAIRKQ